MIIADTSGLLAYLNVREHDHEDVVRVVSAADDALAVSPYVVAELDYMVAARGGVDAELEMLNELVAGSYVLCDFGAEELLAASAVIERYHDQEIGVTDASLVVLADRYRTRTILTLDRRHFDVLRPLTGGRFKVIP